MFQSLIARSLPSKKGLTSLASRTFQSSSRTLQSSKSSTASRDTRIAGRLRFYKQVGVEKVQAPDDAETTTEGDVASPISAGVDGTDAATGVLRPDQESAQSTFRDMILPKVPGVGTAAVQNKDSINWYGVSLDGRLIKTPMGQRLAVPSELLATMIAAEWDAQEKHLQPANMPLMTLACTALDQVAHHPLAYREQCLRYLPTDTTCFWADPEEDRVLHRRQEEAWKELHDFVESKFDHPPSFAQGATEAMAITRKNESKPFAGLPHHPELIDGAIDWTYSLDAWHLTAFHSICSQAKSFLVAWAILERESPLECLHKAMDASRVEEEFQISNWGLVEGGHDYDRLNCSIQIHSSSLFAKTIVLDNELRAPEP
eukprot:Nitzschia sp. Nitz4//scaffold7_size249615//154446//155627//NITZ4_001185-RA/size249615-augustus-gene-0.11-mRNA-1//1//CDS//3329558466//3928//frame0